jgi:hypothetical protein
MHLRLLATALIIAALMTGSAPATSDAPPAGLTRPGWVRWQFEALLRDTFHSSYVSAHYKAPGWWWNFACSGRCAPLAYWNPYFFEFRNARGTRFHVSKRSDRPNFGNYPIPIKVKGHLVACDRAETHLLITYGDAAGLSLACLRP